VSDLYFHEKLRNIINERLNLIDEHITEGIVEDFTAYKVLRGKREELATLSQEIEILLKKVEYD
jgi:predicted transcriptional regulator